MTAAMTGREILERCEARIEATRKRLGTAEEIGDIDGIRNAQKLLSVLEYIHQLLIRELISDKQEKLK